MEKHIKPWGYYEDLHRDDKVVFKRIVIYPGHQISVQKHSLRNEFWFIYSGCGNFYLGLNNNNLELSDVTAGNSLHIPKEFIHCIKNTGEKDLIIFETQYGVCAESDIVRFEDPYAAQR